MCCWHRVWGRLSARGNQCLTAMLLVLVICLTLARRLVPVRRQPHRGSCLGLLYSRAGVNFSEPCVEWWGMLSSLSCLQVRACTLRGRTCAIGCMRLRMARVVWRMVFEVLICMLLQATGPFAKASLQVSGFMAAQQITVKHRLRCLVLGHKLIVKPMLQPEIHPAKCLLCQLLSCARKCLGSIQTLTKSANIACHETAYRPLYKSAHCSGCSRVFLHAPDLPRNQVPLQVPSCRPASYTQHATRTPSLWKGQLEQNQGPA